jgi:hypothetical protein
MLYENYKTKAGPNMAKLSRPTLDPTVHLPRDDWPFLYLKGPMIPSNYWPFLAIIILLGFATLLLLPRGERRIRLPYFLFGAAFFLIETSNIVSLSLLFGSTWSVNAIVFCGILILVLMGNVTAYRFSESSLPRWFLLLFISISVAYFTKIAILLSLPHALLRAAVAVLIFLGPVYFAAIIFAILIKNEPQLFQAYGSNVLGAVVGGACEYLSLFTGFKSLLLITLALYLFAFILWRIRPQGRTFAG